jgi:hypothetical protein
MQRAAVPVSIGLWTRIGQLVDEYNERMDREEYGHF